ncbi:MAG: hypothetical protein Q8O75_01355, partial [bacterium]|nr:hypothetical protein [bacterium]
SGQSVYQGSTFYVSVRVNTGGASVDTVQANLSYPADKLDFLGLSYGGTSFEIQAEGSGGGGSVRMGRGTISAKSGDLLVATISFKARVTSGSATVSFVGGTEADRAGTVIVSATSGGTYMFTQPPPPPTPVPKDTTAPKISDIKIVNIGLNTANVSWKTNEKASSIVEYGPSKKLGLIASSTNLATAHNIALSTKLLFPGSTYYYQIKSVDAAGNEVKSEVYSFKTKGYKVKLKIVDADGRPLANVKVNLTPGLEKATTDQNGVVVFGDLASGVHSVQVTVEGQVLAQTITVSEEQKPDKIQEFKVKVAAASTSVPVQVATYSGVFVLGLIAALLAVGLVWWRRQSKISKSTKEKKDE